MTYHFTILSPENEDFVRRIAIDNEATFLSFHEAIIASVGYEPQEMSSFFTSNEDWERLEEITLLDMQDADCMIMDDTLLCDIVSKRKDKLIYLFDFLSNRGFYIELSKITTETMSKEHMCTLSQGKAPRQKDDDFMNIDFESLRSTDTDGKIPLKKQKQTDLLDDLPELDDLEKFESIDDIENIDDFLAADDFLSDDEYY